MISDNLRKVRQELQDSCALVARGADEVTLVGVTKTVDLEQTIALVKLGVTDIAENRVDRLLAKKAALQNFPEVKFHFIGNLQRRKVKSVINEIDYFHALDSLSLANEIQKRAEHVIACFVEVNISGETSKQGVSPETLESFIYALKDLDKICVVGLMTMAPLRSTPEEQHEIFSCLKKLQEKVAQLGQANAPCQETSMGMSNDFSVAVAEGASYVRIGTALFQE